MNLKPQIILLSILIIFASYQAIAADFSKMKNEFEEYKGSEYQNDSIRQDSRVKGFKGAKEDTAFKELKKVQIELSRKKDDEKSRIELVVLKNGLFEPDAAIWERIKNEEPEKILNDDFSLKTALAVALKNNLEIQRAYKGANASIERYDQVSNLDEILNQYAVFTKNLEINIGELMLSNKPVMLNFPFPGMLELKGNIVEKDIELSKIELKKTVQDVITEIRETYYETAYLYSAIAITKDVIEILQRMEGAVKTVYITGRGSMNDVIKIKMEIDRMDAELTTIERKKRTVQVKLNKLLNIREDFAPRKIEDLKPVIIEYAEDVLLRNGERERAEIKELSVKLDRMKLMIEMAEKEFYPDFTLGFSIFQNRTIQQVGSNALDMPFSDMPMKRTDNWFGKNDAYIREIRIKYQEMQKMAENTKNMTVIEINEAVTRYENADTMRNLYEIKLAPKLELTVDIAESLYKNRKIDFMDLIGSQELYLKNNLMLKESTKEMNIGAARIERLVGYSVGKELGVER